uniref:NADH-ubiquinone oxidoreductase chain 2 n=1 Tax=Agrilus mali TaxID=1917227 RepID=A0A6M4ZYD6_9COLE|nr:NADH dehydrogenase subunit 2 [Agrilus mali]
MPYLYKTLFLMTLMMGTLISISANSWMGSWIGLEMNLLSIIPLMNNSKNPQSTEASLKYFIVQAMASMILLMSFIMDTIKSDLPMNLLTSCLPSTCLTTALLIKTGTAPFHFWFPEVMEGLSWVNALILLTWQKIAPLVILMYNNNEMILLMAILFSVLVGGLIGLNQTSLRKILSYSSINHIGWMLAAMLFLETLWTWYFILYSIMNTMIIWVLKKFNISSISQLINISKLNPQLKIFFMFNFFSLGGIPPFIGFLPKWLTIQALIYNQMYLTTTLMIITTLITLYFYMRMTFPMISFSISAPTIISMNKHMKNYFLTMVNSMLLMSLIFSTMAFNWF